MEKLNQWLAKHNVRQAELARLSGVSEAALSRLRSGASLPSYETRKKIQTATNGAVGIDDWTARAAE